MSFSPHRPYNDLPDLPPMVDIESKPVLKACTATRVALAALRQATALIPNPTVLINSIPLLEAQASSEIENIITTNWDDYFEKECGATPYVSPEDFALKNSTEAPLTVGTPCTS